MSEYLHTISNDESLNPDIDIVFVHGLNPKSKPNFARSTWTNKQGNYFWPEALLQSLKSARIPISARILIFSYNSQVARDVSTNGIQEHANNLLDRLDGARRQKPRQGSYTVPIIFVAHSLGGLVVKQALVTAKNNAVYEDIRDATYGLVFFAVPHQGGHGATLGAIAKNIIVSLTGDGRNDLVESLQQNSLFQENQASLFKFQLEDYYIVSIFENKPMKFTGFMGRATSLIIVDQKSATLGLAGTRERLLSVNSNHSDVCKFEGDDDKFEPIKRAIGDLANRAIWDANKAIKKQADARRAQVPDSAPIHPIFGEVVYQPAKHYNTLQLGFFHAGYQLMKTSLQSLALARKNMEFCETEFRPFSNPDGNQFSIDDLKNPIFFQVIQKIGDPYQLFFACLGWAGCLINLAKFTDDGGSYYQMARAALYEVRQVDFGGVENTIVILRTIDAEVPWVLANYIMQQQHSSIHS